MTLDEKLEAIYAFMGGRWQAIRNWKGLMNLYDGKFKSKQRCEKLCQRINEINKDETPVKPMPIDAGNSILSYKLCYNTSLDALMPVIDKLDQMGYVIVITKLTVAIAHKERSSLVAAAERKGYVESHFQVVSRFINDYNERIRASKTGKGKAAKQKVASQ